VSTLTLLLSREHPTLPAAEVKAVLESEGFSYRVVHLNPPIMVVEVDLRACKRLEERLAMTMEGFSLLFSCSPDLGDVLTHLRDLELNLPAELSFAVRVLRKTPSVGLRSLDFERAMGEVIAKRTNAKVNLKKPDVLFRGVIADRFYFGVRVFTVKRGSFDLRRPRYRPFFHPGSMEPRVCRVFVNLARPRAGSVLLDPFSGTGGILIEASMVGCHAIGVDIDGSMVQGSIVNLKSLNCQFLGVIRGDARMIPLREGSVDCIATDPPYGRSTSLKRVELAKLLARFMDEAPSAVKRDGHICMAYPSWLDLDIPSDFRLVEEHDMKVHRSLTRRIVVLRRL